MKLALILSMSAAAALGQTVSSTDGLTPVALSPGSPAGSYVLSGLDTVSLYNGGANIAIPLVKIGGRGQVGYTMVAQYGPHWNATGSMQPCSPDPTSTCPTWSFGTSSWANWSYMYQPAGIAVRHMGSNVGQVTCPDNSTALVYSVTLTRLVVGLPDGSEVTLVDEPTTGSPEQPNLSSFDCNNPMASAYDRGTRWVSVDGSGMTFVSDIDILDGVGPGSFGGSGGADGTLYLRDGTQYHFSGLTTPPYGDMMDWMQDRNGNRITFAFNVTLPPSFPAGFQYNFSITDPVGRVTYVAVGNTYTFTNDAAAGCTTSTPCLGRYDQIVYPGAGGTPRTIQVQRRSYWYDRMQSLQSSALPSHQGLFGGYASPSVQPWDWAISQVILPDGHSYQFHYTEYAEVSRLDLPTGGAYEFDWTNGPNTAIYPYDICPANPDGKCPVIVAPSLIQSDLQSSGYDLVLAVYRRVKERREYANGGSAWTRRTTYDVLETNAALSGDPLGQCGFVSNAQFVSGYCSQVTVNEYDPNLGQLSSEVHYFYGGASQSQSLFPQPGWYSWWLEGREVRTDTIEPGATSTTLREQLRTWQNRVLPAWWSAFPNESPEPPVDARVGMIDTVIDNGKMSRRLVVYSSDAFNNVADVYEYDYGSTSGSQGNLLRHTHTDYVTDATYTATPVHLLSLPKLVTVDSGGGALSQLQYCYDESASSGGTGTNAACAAASSQHGNLTTLEKWRNTDSLWLNTATAYDPYGNPTSVQNPRGYTTNYTYACSNSFLYQLTNAKSQQTTYNYDCNLGKPTSIVDSNGITTTVQYNDPLDRPTHLTLGDGANVDYQYSTDLKTVTVVKDLDAGRRTTTSTTTDLLGRVVQTVDAAGVSTLRALDALGRLHIAYNPGSTTAGTTYTYDALNRSATVTYADGSPESSQWTGDFMVHTDPSPTSTQQQVDALGRLLQVVEGYGGANSPPPTPTMHWTISVVSRSLAYSRLPAQREKCIPVALNTIR